MAPTFMAILRFLKLLVSTADESASSRGRMRGSISMRVTSVSNAFSTSANSQPTAPAPIMAMDLGASLRNSASSVEITFVLSSSSPACGRPFTRVPVAITTPLDAVYVSFPTFTFRPA